MSPLPPTGASSPTTTQPILYHVAHHTSPPSHSTTYENFLIVLIVAYLLWALFYGFYMLLRMGIWLFEKLKTLFIQIMTIKIQQPDVYDVACVTELWIENKEKDSGSGKMRLVDSGVWIPVHTPEKKDLEWVVRRRSGTI